MSIANSLWGASRIHGELLKLGIDIVTGTEPMVSLHPKASINGHSRSTDVAALPLAKWIC
jgi:hypothetical protein